ncbi:MAG: T9SS type A sorting domain-containing protein, partial [Bacteroidia bacterium]|nr:T9SS type A sorting domain-containing protein [Bacteroidia bacterium]
CRLKSSCNATYRYSISALLTVDNSLNSSNRLKEIQEETTKGNIEEKINVNFVLYPNPAKETINIDYSVCANAKVEIIMYDMLGRKVEDIIINNELEAGDRTTEFNIANYQNGTYSIIVSMKDRLGKIAQTQKRLVIIH